MPLVLQPTAAWGKPKNPCAAFCANRVVAAFILNLFLPYYSFPFA